MASDADTNDALRIPSPLPGVRQPSKPTDRAGLRRRSAYLADLISGHAHSHGGYDGEYKLALSEGEVGNGVRTWYSTFTTIGERVLARHIWTAGSSVAHRRPDPCPVAKIENTLTTPFSGSDCWTLTFLLLLLGS